VPASSSECEALVRKLEKQDFGHFDIGFDVIYNLVLGQFCVAVMAVNRKDPDSKELPTFDLPLGWMVHPHWDWAQAAGAHVGMIFKRN